jgi:hypothetical protein
MHGETVKFIKTHFVFSNFFFPENRAVCEKMWKSNIKRGSPQMTKWRMRIACWIPKATNTHTQVVYYSMLFHSNNGCTIAPQCYVIRLVNSVLCWYCNTSVTYHGIVLARRWSN